MTIAIEPQSQPTDDRLAHLRAIDTDVHNDLPSYAELKPFLASAWHPWLEQGGPVLPRAPTPTWAPGAWTTPCARKTAWPPATPSGSSSS